MRKWRIAAEIPRPLCGPDELLFGFLKGCERHGVRYVVVGGYAVRYHGVGRQPMDLDVFVDSSGVNCKRVIAALREMGAKKPGEQFDPESPPVKLQFLTPAGPIEVFTAMAGLDFEAVYERSESTIVGDTTIRVIGLADLIEAKRLACDDPACAERAAKHWKDLDALLRIQKLRQAEDQGRPP